MSHHYSRSNITCPRGDARLDVCDLFAFHKPGDASKSILIIDVHPSVNVSPPGPTTAEPFAPEAIYEIMVDTNNLLHDATPTSSNRDGTIVGDTLGWCETGRDDRQVTPK
jgi:hypothetical protein